MTIEGDWKNVTKSIELTGKAMDAITDKDVVVPQIIKFIDNDHQEMQMFDTKYGSEKKVLEIKMIRKK